MSVKFEQTSHRIGPVEIIGQSPQTRAMLDFIDMAAANDFPVLLAGRQDLYYRLAVLIFVISPLRDRPDDVLPLARHFLAVHCERLNRPAPSLTAEAEAALLQYHWPGNVRELVNVIERAIALDQGMEIGAESLIFDVRWKPQPATGRAPLDSQEHHESPIPAGVKFDDLVLHEKREAIKRALQRYYGSREKAARSLGLSRFQLHRLMKKLGIRDEIKGEQ